MVTELPYYPMSACNGTGSPLRRDRQEDKQSVSSAKPTLFEGKGSSFFSNQHLKARVC